MNKILKIVIVMLSINTAANAQDISKEFPFESKYESIEGNKIHYIDEGTGDPILFLHGIPMSSYAWRNIIPGLMENNRCIAIDFMGFGKSDKPDLDYTFVDQYYYLEKFIEARNLENITIVMTDIGGVLGTKYAMENPDKIKGLVFMETPFADARTFHKNGGMMQHMLFGMGAKEKMSYNMFVKRNMFIKMMPKLIKRKMLDEELEVYASPFPTLESRIPMLRLIQAFPKKGKNVEANDMGDFMNKNNEKLMESDLPKLVLYSKPGMLTTKKTRKWILANLKNTKMEFVGKAKHLMEEDLPFEISEAIQKWTKEISK